MHVEWDPKNFTCVCVELASGRYACGCFGLHHALFYAIIRFRQTAKLKSRYMVCCSLSVA